MPRKLQDKKSNKVGEGTYLPPPSTHIHTHKAKPTAAMRNIDEHWDACAPLWHLSLVQANPPGAGLVIHRRNAQVLWREVDSNATKQVKDSWAFASPGTHWCYS